MKSNKLFLILVLIVRLSVVVACIDKDEVDEDGMSHSALNNLNESDFPIVDEEITLKMFTAKSDANIKVDWNDLPVWNNYEDMTHINLDWIEQVTGDSLEEKRNLALGVGNMPDVLFASKLST